MPPILKVCPDIDSIWHPRKNTQPIETVTNGQHTKIWVLRSCTYDDCKCPHEYEAVPSNLIKNGKLAGCSFCSPNSKQRCFHRMLAHTHPAVAAQWDYDKNKDLKPENMPSSSNALVWWKCTAAENTCKCIHSWQAIIANRTRHGHGCPYCSVTPKSICIHQSIVHTHPDIAAQWDHDKNKDLKPENVSFGSDKDVWWLCTAAENTCGCIHSWVAAVGTRCGSQPCGCPYCATNGKAVCIHQTIAHTHPHIAAEWDEEKNGDLTPDQVSFGSEIMIWWKCSSNHSYNSIIGNRCRQDGSGCPHCKHKTQKFVLELLRSIYSDVIAEFKITATGNFRFDFCIPSLMIIIELDGGQHFKQVWKWMSPEECIERDKFKMDAARSLGYKIIRISQQDVYDSSLKGDGKWTRDMLLGAIKSEDRGDVYISRNPALYEKHRS